MDRPRVDPEPLVCDVSSITHPDLGTVDELARRCLDATRLGRRLTVDGASPELWGLLDLVGLAERLGAVVSVERERESEEREHPRGVEEERHPDDLPA